MKTYEVRLRFSAASWTAAQRVIRNLSRVLRFACEVMGLHAIREQKHGVRP